MPFRRHFGFVFMENSQQLKANSQKLNHTIAHELAHGAFGLEHPRQSKGTTQGDTYNLLDYTTKTPNNLLRKYQWYVIHNPRLSLFGGDEEEVSSVYTSSKAYIIINSVVISDEIKASLQNKGAKEKMDMINGSWKAWNKKWEIQDGNIDPHDWISKCKIQGYRVNEYLHVNRKFYQKFGNNNGIPNIVIEAVNPKRILTEGVEIWGVRYINNKDDGKIEYYEIERISKIKITVEKDKLLDFVAKNGIPFIGDNEARVMSTIFNLLMKASKSTDNVLTLGDSEEGRIGVALASAGATIATNYATDRYGNMAFVVSGSFHGSYYEDGWSFADNEAGAANGGHGILVEMWGIL